MNPEDKKFRTPDEVAAEDPSPEPTTAGGAEDASFESKELSDDEIMASKPKSRWHSKWNAFNRLNWPPGKKEWIILAVIVLLLIGGGVAYALTHKQPETLKPIPKITDASKTVPSTLTGLPVDPSVNKRTVTAVMIENTDWARPQAGLSQAGVVFEAIAEAGITRFLALYQDTAPNNVGPIRSARPYFVGWSMGFDAGYAHVGGSPDALADISKWHVRDLNQSYNGNYYHRISSRAAPHNVYTSIHDLNELEVAKGYDTSHFTGFARKTKAWRPKNQPITARNINLNISSADYNVHYTYDPNTNTYLRSEGGAPQIDSNGNKRIRPVVVIAMVMPYSLGPLDTSGAYYSNYGFIGGGQVLIFQNGQVTKAAWHKKSNQSQLTFIDSKGKAVQLNPGQTWITALGGANQVTYSAK